MDALTQDNLLNQREVVKERRSASVRQRAVRRCPGALDHLDFFLRTIIRTATPLSVPWQTWTPQPSFADVGAFFRRYYLPNNAVLTIAGDIEPEDGFARAETYFGSSPCRTASPSPQEDPMPPFRPADDLPRVETSGPVPAEAVYVSRRLPARDVPEFDALDLLFGVLGHGQTSRLTRDSCVRQELGGECVGDVHGPDRGQFVRLRLRACARRR